MAIAGNVVSATAKYEEAKRLDNTLLLNPRQEAHRVVTAFQTPVSLDSSLVPSEVERATQQLKNDWRTLAYAGNITGAIVMFETALVLDPSLPIESEDEAKRIYAQAILDEGHNLALIGNVD